MSNSALRGVRWTVSSLRWMSMRTAFGQHSAVDKTRDVGVDLHACSLPLLLPLEQPARLKGSEVL